MLSTLICLYLFNSLQIMKKKESFFLFFSNFFIFCICITIAAIIIDFKFIFQYHHVRCVHKNNMDLKSIDDLL